MVGVAREVDNVRQRPGEAVEKVAAGRGGEVIDPDEVAVGRGADAGLDPADLLVDPEIAAGRRGQVQDLEQLGGGRADGGDLGADSGLRVGDKRPSECFVLGGPSGRLAAAGSGHLGGAAPGGGGLPVHGDQTGLRVALLAFAGLLVVPSLLLPRALVVAGGVRHGLGQVLVQRGLRLEEVGALLALVRDPAALYERGPLGGLGLAGVHRLLRRRRRLRGALPVRRGLLVLARLGPAGVGDLLLDGEALVLRFPEAAPDLVGAAHDASRCSRHGSRAGSTLARNRLMSLRPQ